MRKLADKLFKWSALCAAMAIMALLGYILFHIIRRGLPAMSLDMLTRIPEGGFYLGKGGGVLNAIVGYIYLILGATIISALISIPVVMYLNVILRKKSFFARFSRLTFDVLFGIPSIVYGAFGFTVMIFFGLKASLLGGIIAIAMLIMPIMIRALDEVALLVPNDLKEAVRSLGATIKVVLQQLRPGITTAILLAVGRGIGDAATVLFTAGCTDSIPTSLSSPDASLPLAIFFQLGSPVEEVQERAYASALILTIIILILSFSARYFSRKFSKNL